MSIINQVLERYPSGETRIKLTVYGESDASISYYAKDKQNDYITSYFIDIGDGFKEFSLIESMKLHFQLLIGTITYGEVLLRSIKRAMPKLNQQFREDQSFKESIRHLARSLNGRT